MNKVNSELLSPAGSFDAALAAFQYGADAIYLGLASHSARAEAVNFTNDQLKSITAYAHSLPKRRSVYVAVNTLVRDDEISSVMESLNTASEADVDGVILQDLSVFELIRRHFPNLKPHASTQLAIHNREGALALADMGFTRVVLARELSLSEIRDITEHVPIETEVFIHGALCYSYSGLCLFSALRTGRSGNRGRCAYCCRSEFAPADSSGNCSAFPFSMKDLFLYDSVRELQEIGVSSLKIEGRMKNPLYVASVTDLYRRKLDGELEDSDASRSAISNMQTVFCRPVTRLHFDGKGSPDDIIDPAAVGHRGAFIGHVQTVRRDREGNRWLAFAPQRPLEAHDGLQVEWQTEGGNTIRRGRPFGFSIDTMRLSGESKPRFSVPSRARVEVLLPQDAPVIPQNARLFCSSSQAVHREFTFATPRASELRHAIPVSCKVELTPTAVNGTFEIPGTSLSVSASVHCTLTSAQKPDLTRQAVEKAFTRLGDSKWLLRDIEVRDDSKLYAPASVLNETRRKLCDLLDDAYSNAALDLSASRRRSVNETFFTRQITGESPIPAMSIKVRVEANPADIDTRGFDEIIIALSVNACRNAEQLRNLIAKWRSLGIPLRLSPPLIVRGEEAAICDTAIQALLADGFRQWECCDIAGLHLLKRLAPEKLSITADGTLYAFNRISARVISGMGVSGAVAPAETDNDQLIQMADYARDWIIAPVRWRPPLFISETRPVIPWEKPDCKHMQLKDRKEWQCTVDEYDGRWLTRDCAAIDRTPLLNDLKSAGITHFRYDLTDLFP